MLLTTLTTAFWTMPVSGHFVVLGAGFFLGKKIYDITKNQAPHYTTFQPDFTAPLMAETNDSFRIKAATSLAQLSNTYMPFARVTETWSIESISLKEKVCEIVAGIFGFNNAASKAKLHYTALKMLYVAEKRGLARYFSRHRERLSFVTDAPLEEQLLAHYKKHQSTLRPHLWSRSNPDVKRTRLGPFAQARYFGDTLRRMGDLVGIARLDRTPKKFTDLRDTLKALNHNQLKNALTGPVNRETLIAAIDEWRDDLESQAALCKPIMSCTFSFDKELQRAARARLIACEFVLDRSRAEREPYKFGDVGILLADLRCSKPDIDSAKRWLALSDTIQENFPADSARAFFRGFLLNETSVENISKEDLLTAWVPKATLFALASKGADSDDEACVSYSILMGHIEKLDPNDQIEVLEAFVDQLGEPHRALIIKLNRRIIELYGKTKIAAPQQRLVDMLFATSDSFDAHLANIEGLIEAQESPQVKIDFYAKLVRYLTQQKEARWFSDYLLFTKQAALDKARTKLTVQYFLAGQHEQCNLERMKFLVEQEELNQFQHLDKWAALGSNLADRGEHDIAVSALWRAFELKKTDLSEADFEQSWLRDLDATLNVLHLHNHHYQVLGTCFDYLLSNVRAVNIDQREDKLATHLLKSYAQKLIALFEKNYKRQGITFQRNTVKALQYERVVARLYFIAGSADEWYQGVVTEGAKHLYTEAERIGKSTDEQSLYKAARDQGGTLTEREKALLSIDNKKNKKLTFRGSILECVDVKAPFAANRA